jgi:hypothetical protein
MQYYTKQADKYNEVVTDDFESEADRYALRLSRRLSLPISHVRTALLANAAVKEH